LTPRAWAIDTLVDHSIPDAQMTDATKRTSEADRVRALRYGENPHQRADFYTLSSTRPGVATATLLQGKPLSDNNIADADAAYEPVAEFGGQTPTIAIVKHASPCGVAQGPDPAAAYRRALSCDPVSAFGGVIAANQTVDEHCAREILSLFAEVLIAPGFDESARALFRAKPNVRLLAAHALPDPAEPRRVLKTVAGGLLVQDADASVIRETELRIVSKAQPTAEQVCDMLFAFKVVKHAISNEVVFARDGQTAGIGGGQVNRRDAARIAAWRAADSAQRTGAPALTVNAACASDAYLSHPDALREIWAAGATALIQPGGSISDAKVIAAADEAGLVMAFTGVRAFRH